MDNSENKYKDALPFDTIDVTHRSLHQIGIDVFEKKWEDVSEECYSVRIEIDGFHGLGTNGKGTTRSYALASAYGEIMERIQNKKIFHKTYGLKCLDQPFPDEKIGDMKEFSVEHPQIMAHLVHGYDNDTFFELFKKYPKLSYFSNYYDVFGEKRLLLPSTLIDMACGTNGMCAGNSLYEALCHGICEIMERYVSKQILYHQLMLPEIPIEEIQEQKIINIIKILKEAGLSVVIKDCTLGGVYPVVGVLLFNNNKTRYQFRLGSESVFSIALERCLTEVLQGHNVESFKRDSMLPVEYQFCNNEKSLRENLSKTSKNGMGQFPVSIFLHVKPNMMYSRAFLSESKNNKQNYEHLISQLKLHNFQLYIRNLSFLNFPSYKIFIPGMSEIFINDTNKIERRIKTNLIANYLLNIQSCTKKELEFLLDELEEYCNRNTNSFCIDDSPFFRSTNLHLKEGNEFDKIDIRLIVTLLGYVLYRDDIAARYFTWYLKSLPDGGYSNLIYNRCIMAFLQFKADRLDDNEIHTILNQFFPKNTVLEVLHDFNDRSTKLFSKIPVPSCPDCLGCQLAKSCLWEEWEKKNTVINMKLSNFSNFHVIQ
ncbi:MAG: YcaO-like family protein [Oscillospiraceae bacterium]|jgi:ribosomal protein S12 methylthiotransferase accessory factor|nr:YcaO-like family protein [Oscillospiraceae bacterium]